MQIPFNESFEKAVLIGILSDPSLFPKISTIISEKDFFKQDHQEIFRTIASMEIDQIDSLTVQDKLSDSTKEYFSDLVKDSDSLVPSLSNVLYYAEQIKADSRLRDGIDLGRQIITTCLDKELSSDDALQRLEDMFAVFLQQRVSDSIAESTKEAFSKFLDNLGQKVVDDDITKSGFFALDMLLHRLEGLVILAARPGVGKTSLAINIARNVAETKPVVFFSLEQTQEQIFERMLSAESEVPLEEIRTGAFLADDIAVSKIEDAKKRLLPVFDRIHVDEKSEIPTSYITSVARQKNLEWGKLGLIVIDYLHIVRLGNKHIVDALGDATKEIRALGKELECPVLLLSQLSRQPDISMNDDGKRKRRRPELSDLRASGEIEQSADIVIFLNRESYYDSAGYIPEEDPVEVIVKKNRNGRTGITTMMWLPRFVKFKDD